MVKTKQNETKGSNLSRKNQVRLVSSLKSFFSNILPILFETRKSGRVRAFNATDFNIQEEKETHKCYLIPREWKEVSTKLSSIWKEAHTHRRKKDAQLLLDSQGVERVEHQTFLDS